MLSKKPVCFNRIRKITGSFSWIDHRILSLGYLMLMSKHELLLYFFLVLVGDKNGVSFYGYDKICQYLKITPDEFVRARDALLKRELIAFKQGRFQVLQLPEKCSLFSRARAADEPASLKDIFAKLI